MTARATRTDSTRRTRVTGGMSRPFVSWLFLALVACGGSGAKEDGPRAAAAAGREPDATTVDKEAVDAGVEHDAGPLEVDVIQSDERFDAPSKTTYHLTRVRHEDGGGKLVKLRHAHASEQAGETIPAFAARMNNPALVINASPGIDGLPADTRQATGMQVIDGVVVQERSTIRHTLGIKADNTLVTYPPGTTTRQMLDDGAINALSAFTPLIVDHETVSEEVRATVANYPQAHPRQAIAQFDDLDLLILSCGGRGFGGDGMTALDVIRVLQEEGVRFAFMLDGGGSVATAIKGKLITERIDGDGTQDRPRPNFLYVE